MIKEAMQWLAEQNMPEEVVVDPQRLNDELVFQLDGYHQITPAMPNGIDIATLDGWPVYVSTVLGPDTPELFFKVDLAGTVTLFGEEHPITRNRARYGSSSLPPIGSLTQCGSDTRTDWQYAEQMIPALLTQFDESENRAALLKVLGNVTDGTVHTFEDDGVGQQVTTKRGVSMKQLEVLPSPLSLSPKANYPELYNPHQQYVLRAQGGSEDCPPTFKLIRIFDPLYEHSRRRTIVAWLEEHVGIPII